LTNTIELGQYNAVLDIYEHISEILNQAEILDIQTLESMWRKENLLLKITCETDTYVFKQIHDKDKCDEMDRMKLLCKTYPCLVPKIFCFENDAYLMEYIPGRNFFELNDKERVDLIKMCGKSLNAQWSEQKSNNQDISEKIKNSFCRYRLKSAKFFSSNELLDCDVSMFYRVPSVPSHNDLNAANLLYTDTVRVIDPSDEGYEDVARDIGRYCASTFFNNYDRFGNNKTHSLDIACAFLENFDDSACERAKYYIGESFMSFLNFQTATVEKSVLKNLAKNMLTQDKKIVRILEESI
jgi:thiamine kinase-like enzyme